MRRNQKQGFSLACWLSFLFGTKAGLDLEVAPRTHPASTVFEMTVKMNPGKAGRCEWNRPCGELASAPELGFKPPDFRFLQ